jgi:hypothetical protein
MKAIILFLFLLLIIVGCTNNDNVISVQNLDTKKLSRIIIAKMEYAYFEGQKDYQNNDIRIGWDFDNGYYWKASPWGGTNLNVKWHPGEKVPQLIINTYRR